MEPYPTAPHTAGNVASDTPDWVDLAIYLDHDARGMVSPEHAAVTAWLARDPRRSAVVTQLAQAWERPVGDEFPYLDAHAALAHVTSRLGVARSYRECTRPLPQRWPHWRSALAGAVATTVLATGTVFMFVPGLHPASPVASQEYRTGNGQRATVQLNDGSWIVLGPATTLHMANRTVQLQGEALFSVQNAQHDPFIVHAAGTTTTVLGTEFGVRAYDEQVSVAVRSGKVQLENVVLAPRDIATATVGQNPTVVPNSDVDRVLSFAHGKLALSNVTLTEAIPELNRWFDVDIRLTDPALGAKKFETTVRGGSANDLAAMLEFVFRVRVVRDGRTLTVMSK